MTSGDGTQKGGWYFREWVHVRCSTDEQNEVRQIKMTGDQKADGKYKGRTPIPIDEAKFRAICASWRSGEIMVRIAMKEVGLKPNTFYRRVHNLGL